MASDALRELHERQLANLLRQGNRMAFTEIYERYWKRLYNYVFNILNDQDLTEDVLQDTFTRIWVVRENLEIQNLKAYLFNACRNNAISKLRQIKLTKFQEDIIESLSQSPEIELSLDLESLKTVIGKATAVLPERCREIFYLSRIEHFTIQEIAEKLNISHRTVENQLSIALKHVRLMISDPHFLLILANACAVVNV